MIAEIKRFHLSLCESHHQNIDFEGWDYKNRWANSGLATEQWIQDSSKLVVASLSSAYLDTAQPQFVLKLWSITDNQADQPIQIRY